MDRLPKMFPDRLITFTGADFEVAGGSATSNSDLEEPEAEPEPGPSFDIENICHNGHVLANQYELVRTIFSYLPMRDLENCGKVTQLWNEVKRICMKERKRYDSVSFYWSGKCADVSYYSKYELFQSPHHRQLYEAMEKFSSEILIKPKIAIIFGSGDTDLSVRDSSPGLEPEDHMEKSWLVDKGGVLSKLPRDCLAIGTTSRGIVGTSGGISIEQENLFDEVGHGLERPNENNMLCPAMSMLLIPEKPGVKILPFHLAENQLEPLIEEIKKDAFYLENESVLQEKLLEKAVKGLQPEDKIRAVILLSNGLDLPFSMHLIQGAAARSKNKLAIGGAVGDLCWSSLKDTSMLALMRELFYFNYQSVPVAENSYMSTSGFVIAGENVQASSVLLPRKVRSEKRIIAELQKLKNSGISEDNSFAFMFACCGRGENHYRGKSGLEAATFNKMFPKTPLVGVFGNGEIGISHIPDFNAPTETSEKVNALKPGQFLHSFTTIFVMVSFGSW
eukprot:TRINITY_DN10678_c0_g1_i2.p1 TRINITY_DN10678_c0_g1~~TRINITY_DN10678_c0_g1_i2.p1  ORF type:complete len:505 (-),score=106.60 TRINITY_DN10678_c0_g1_i2:35-1549(-)